MPRLPSFEQWRFQEPFLTGRLSWGLSWLDLFGLGIDSPFHYHSLHGVYNRVLATAHLMTRRPKSCQCLNADEKKELTTHRERRCKQTQTNRVNEKNSTFFFCEQVGWGLSVGVEQDCIARGSLLQQCHRCTLVFAVLFHGPSKWNFEERRTFF